MTTIYKNSDENINFTIKDADSATVDVDDITECNVSLVHRRSGKAIITYIKGELEMNATTNVITIHLGKSVTATAPVGIYDIYCMYSLSDEDFAGSKKSAIDIADGFILASSDYLT
jgi:hypothetical protein